MITNITLENFKCFRHVSINPKLLTVLIGPNGTGKSSALQALLLLKQSVGTDELVIQGESINLSEPDDIIPNFRSRDLVSRLEIHVSSGSGTGREIDSSNLEFHAEFGSNLRLFRPGQMDIGVQADVPRGSSPVGRALHHMSFVPAIRGFSRPIYKLGPTNKREVPLQLSFDGQEEQVATNLVYSRSSEEKLSNAMKKVTETGIRADMIPSNSVAIKSVNETRTANLVNEGSGTNALILPFHQLLGAEAGATVLIEEPEIHLHPKAQADLAEVLAETAQGEDKQIIMTTHSEHLVERLLLLVAEGTLSPDDVAIYSFSKDEKGECFASEIEVLDNGQVEGGLTDFYANNLETLDRRVKALKRAK